jgi:hypothetical protein
MSVCLKKSEALVNKRIFTLIAMAVVMVFLAGCNLPATPTEESGYAQTQIHLFAQATLTKQAEEKALVIPPTEIPPTEIPPTNLPATLAPTQPADTQIPVVTVVPVTPIPVIPTAQVSSSGRISFAAGTTNGQIKETIPANTIKRYSIRLMQSQMAEVSLSSTASAHIAITTEKGRQLVNFDQKWTWYRDYASENGDWYIDVRTGAYASDITLNVMAPQRVSFASGKDSLTAKATVPAYYTHNFTFWASKDQTMKVNLNPADGLVLTVYKLGGDVLLSSGAGATGFEGKLPATGDYIVNVSNTTNANRTFDFNLTIK